jgi:hypothetical protein
MASSLYTALARHCCPARQALSASVGADHAARNRLWNKLQHDNLPACVKYIQHRQGLGFFHPRAPMDEVSSEQKKAIDEALRALSL